MTANQVFRYTRFSGVDVPYYLFWKRLGRVVFLASINYGESTAFRLFGQTVANFARAFCAQLMCISMSRSDETICCCFTYSVGTPCGAGATVEGRAVIYGDLA
jgi:hypothetical protein